jgi:hypothetical protein
MFSAIWAIANQEAGTPLGQAAALLYAMPPGTITDVVRFGSATNITASIQESSSVTDNYSAAQLVAPLESTKKFYSVLWDYPLFEDTTYVLRFGTDSSLRSAPGWDDVTGLGVPNGKALPISLRAIHELTSELDNTLTLLRRSKSAEEHPLSDATEFAPCLL